MQVTLKDGLQVADEKVYHLKLRRLTTADLMDAELESESPIMTPAGIKLLVSPTVMGYELIRRSVCKVGDDPRPLELKELRKLSEHDFNILQSAYYGFNKSTSGAGMSDEGRNDAAHS